MGAAGFDPVGSERGRDANSNLGLPPGAGSSISSEGADLDEEGMWPLDGHPV